MVTTAPVFQAEARCFTAGSWTSMFIQHAIFCSPLTRFRPLAGALTASFSSSPSLACSCYRGRDLAYFSHESSKLSERRFSKNLGVAGVAEAALDTSDTSSSSDNVELLRGSSSLVASTQKKTKEQGKKAVATAKLKTPAQSAKRTLPVQDESTSKTNLDNDDINDNEEADWPPLVCCFGEAIYEFLPSVRVSEKIMDSEIYSQWKGLQWSPPEFGRLPGSFPSNVAVALARLGGRVAFMGKVGDDEHGRDLVLKLNTNGVQTRAVKFDKKSSTGVSRLRLTTREGHVYMSCVRPSAEDSLVKSEVNLDVLKESRLFQFTSFSLTSEPIRTSLFSAIKVAKKNGADIFFDVNLPLRYWRSVTEARELIKLAWKEATFVEVSKDEIEFLLGEDYYEMLRNKTPAYFSPSLEATKKKRYRYHYHPDEVAPLWHKKMKILFVLDGIYHIHYYTANFHGEVEGTEDVLLAPFTCDRTGSGDAVTAAIIRKLTSCPEIINDEVKLQKALRFCVCAGIIAQWTKGAIRGMPTESAAQNLTEQVYPKHMIA